MSGADARVLDAVAREDTERAVVEPDGNRRREGPFGVTKALGDGGVHVGVHEGLVELPECLEEKRIVELRRERVAPRGRGLRLGHATQSIQALQAG
jgi:hypothetical protein